MKWILNSKRNQQTVIENQKNEYLAKLKALDASQAVIEFDLDGIILTANDNFLAAMGYQLDEIVGQHHHLFVPKEISDSQEYRNFWEQLKRGNFKQGEFKRIAKNNREVWIQATYNPILDKSGHPYKVVKFATDITEQKLADANFKGQIDAINKAQAVIEFNMDGTVLCANDNFLNTTGYTLNEIKGLHHSVFVPSDIKNSEQYRNFWHQLNLGKFQAGEYKRITKGGNEIWIQATYNPIFDLNGNPYKVVKFATDITSQKLADANFSGQINAINKAQAVIEFELDGTIISANDNFLSAMGYTLAEIKGQHHSLFAPDELKNSAEYIAFWQKLNRGEFEAGEYKRIAKGGREIWIQASYNPIYDLSGKPYKVVKFATDITAQKLSNAYFEGQIDAISKAQAVIEFNMDGTIVKANENFLQATGYTLDEIKGQHHSLFAPNELKNSTEYIAFWQKLNRGEFEAGEYKRIAKNGQEIWIQASYNPIFDLNGQPYKVIKFATDITEQKQNHANFEGQIAAISKAQAVIEFELDGTIITANDNFLAATGYTLDEIKGHHHSLFVSQELKNSQEYTQFWQKLNRGEFEAGEYKRIKKGGEELWINASYNPIFDASGKPYKVVKFATDITEQKRANANFEGQIDAISKAQAVIEFDLDGIIITANDNFLNALGYTLSEIQGQHHRMFAPEELRNSAEYDVFWQKLNRGEFEAGEFKRIAKDGREIWIQASYNPIMDASGKPYKVVKFATDITQQKRANANFEGQINAISKAQAVIEFNLDGTIITANDNFLNTLGYALQEIQGQHHSMFAPEELKNSSEYTAFWQKLNRGEFETGEYKRIAKGGREIWIQASYNPILDANGKPYKVVKFATDITQQKRANANFEGQIDAISKAQAVIEFNMDGTIITANDNFLQTMGYQLNEIIGQHHSIFAPNELKGSSEYKAFWHKLNLGEFEAGEYKRIAKGGSEVWIQASYNPILDANGLPFKVVKFATDVTPRKVAVNEVSSVLIELAKGNLTRAIEVPLETEFQALKDAVNTTVHKLNETLTSITKRANLVSSGSNEIAQGNSDLSQRTEEQAASLEETASSMDEMTTTVAQNADNAKSANTLSLEAKQKAENGGQVVESAVASMTEINQASKKISDIIGVIDEIAFQTNLLALNAAVEAARAGEQGRGFAVVAGEVRNLAQRSAGAAKEIKELIRDSVSKVEEGSRLVDQSGETLKEIIAAVEKVNRVVEGITTASQEQRSGIEQVNKAIMQMDEMTQQNAALVEQAAAASESIVEQVSGMSQSLAFFNISTHRPNTLSAAIPNLNIELVKQVPKQLNGKSVTSKEQPIPAQTYTVAQEEWEEF